MQNKIIAVYVTNSTRQPNLHIRDTCLSIDFTPEGWFWTQIRTRVRNTCAIISAISPRPQWVLLWVLTCLISYHSWFIQTICYHQCCTTCWVRSSENIMCRNRIGGLLFTVSRRLQNIMRICVRNPTFRRSAHLCCRFVTASLSCICVTRHNIIIIFYSPAQHKTNKNNNSWIQQHAGRLPEKQTLIELAMHLAI